MKNNLMVTIELKYWLDYYAINPVIVFEELDKDVSKENIRSKTRNKSGIYGIINTITGDFYIGSAVTNKFYSRFYKHLIKGIGNKNISPTGPSRVLLSREIDVNEYGIDSFAFFILEYYPEEVTKKNNPNLITLETNWIKAYLPSYNILLEAGNSLGEARRAEPAEPDTNIPKKLNRK
jgi:GIY-YIG catalytic domain